MPVGFKHPIYLSDANLDDFPFMVGIDTLEKVAAETRGTYKKTSEGVKYRKYLRLGFERGETIIVESQGCVDFVYRGFKDRNAWRLES